MHILKISTKQPDSPQFHSLTESPYIPGCCLISAAGFFCPLSPVGAHTGDRGHFVYPPLRNPAPKGAGARRSLYGILQQRSHRTADPRRSSRCRSRHLRSHQPTGGLRQRQPRCQIPRHEAAHSRWRCGTHRYHAGTFAFRTFRVNDGILKLKGTEFDTTRKVNENQQELWFIEHRILTMRAAVSRPFTY